MRLHNLMFLLLLAGPALADGATTSVAAGGLPTSELTSAAIRMVLGLAVVLALLGATAWVSRRFRLGAGLRGGLIEVISGLSLGARERVVLLRVGGDQVLVGVSAAGMRTLHVLTAGDASGRASSQTSNETSNQAGNQPGEFANYMDRTP